MKKIIIAILFTTCLLGCKKYLDVNEDPKTPQVVTAESLLPHMLTSTGNNLAFDARYTSRYIQNFGTSAASNISEAHDTPFPGGGDLWLNHYLKLGKAVDQMIFDAEQNEKWNYAGIGKALRAWSWQTCTDHYGEMILKEAWVDNKYIFNYDSQQEIYDEVKKNCFEALAFFAKSSPKVILPSSDQMYGGDKNKWIKFVYGILARNAHNLANKAGYDPLKVIEYCDLSLGSNADNAAIEYLSTIAGNAHFFGFLRANLTTTVQSSTILRMLNGYHRNVSVVDPRIAVMLVKSVDGNYYGAEATFGDPNAAATVAPNVNRKIPTVQGVTIGNGANRYLFKDPVKWPIMSYSEIQFIKSEAALKANDLSKAYDAYKKGIDANIDFVNSYITAPAVAVTAAQKTSFMASASVAQTQGDLRLSDIMCQKYIALWGWGFEQTWTDMRRHHYDTAVYKGYTIPDITRLPANNAGQLAYRFKPQTTEFSYNVAALQAIGAFNPNYHTKEMWFSLP
jgi:Starch-binding associating with outer membrane